MQVSLGPKEGLQRQITVTVPVERVQQSFDKKFNEIKNTAKIDGFRPGKIPHSVIESRFGESIHQEAVSELIRETLFKALEQEDMNPAGMPTITELKADRNEPIEFTAKFEVFPEISLKDLSGAEVEKAVAEVTDEDVNEVLERMRKQRIEWEPVERAAQEGDQVMIDFDGSIEGEKLEGGAGKDMPLELGSGRMIPGFEDGIVGMKAGEEKTIEVNFPKEYHAEKLAGKPAEFKITVHKVSAPKLPELDDNLAKEFGVEGGLDALKKDMREHMETAVENGLKVINKVAVLDKLVELNDISVPESAVEHEMQNMHQQSQQQAGQKEPTPLDDKGREYLREPAVRRVKLGLLVAEYVKRHDIKPDQKQVEEMVKRMSASYDSPDEFVQWFMADKERLSQIEAVVVEDLVAESLMAESNAVEKKMSYDEVLQHQQGGQRG